ncbi:hypothetical protein Gpo141_00009251 [Globisporangium polare]
MVNPAIAVARVTAAYFLPPLAPVLEGTIVAVRAIGEHLKGKSRDETRKLGDLLEALLVCVTTSKHNGQEPTFDWMERFYLLNESVFAYIEEAGSRGRMELFAAVLKDAKRVKQLRKEIHVMKDTIAFVDAA